LAINYGLGYDMGAADAMKTNGAGDAGKRMRGALEALFRRKAVEEGLKHGPVDEDEEAVGTRSGRASKRSRADVLPETQEEAETKQEQKKPPAGKKTAPKQEEEEATAEATGAAAARAAEVSAPVAASTAAQATKESWPHPSEPELAVLSVFLVWIAANLPDARQGPLLPTTLSRTTCQNSLGDLCRRTCSGTFRRPCCQDPRRTRCRN
jgi:hypothetical protein